MHLLTWPVRIGLSVVRAGIVIITISIIWARLVPRFAEKRMQIYRHQHPVQVHEQAIPIKCVFRTKPP